jgi:hypothetical protein
LRRGGRGDANQLQVPLADLIAEAPRPAVPRVVRRGTGPHVSGAAVEAWLLYQGRPAGQSIEIYELSVAAGVAQLSAAHPPGTREHVHLHAGRLRVGPQEHPVELGPGDYAEYAADSPHV